MALIHNFESLLASPYYSKQWWSLSDAARLKVNPDRARRCRSTGPGSTLMELAFDARSALDSVPVLTPLEIAARAPDPDNPVDRSERLDYDAIDDNDYARIRDIVDGIVHFIGVQGLGSECVRV